MNDDLPIPKIPSRTGELSDFQRSFDLCEALCADSQSMRFLVIPGDPYSKARPRFRRNGHAYVGKEDRRQEEITRLFLRRAFDQPMTGNVALGCIFFRPNRQRIDADNMLKHVCDSANGIVYLDDSQVTAILGLVELDPGNPRTVVMIGEHHTTLTRGSDATKPCEHCGTPFSIVGASTSRRYCSHSCFRQANGQADLSEPVPCKNCGQPFRRKRSAQVVCSNECRIELRRGQARRGIPMSRCEECGKQLAHRRGGRCRDCWRANPGASARAEADS